MSQRPGGAPSIASALLRVAIAIATLYVALGLGASYWQVVEAQRLTNDPSNPLSLAAARSAPRGRIFDVRGRVLARNVKQANGESIREYTYPVMAPVLGYKSLVFGASGLEKTYDAELAGIRQLTPGDEMLRKFRARPYDPQDLVLSIDLRLQGRATQALGGNRGAIVAIEPTTGRILALVSAPTFDANRLIDPVEGRAYLKSLSEQPASRSPLLNRATQGRFTPGSVFKIVTAIAGVGSGAIDAGTRYQEQPGEEESGFLIKGFRVRDGHHLFTGGEPLDFLQATEVSCNVWYARSGLRIGGPALLDWAGRLGFGQPIPFELPTAPSIVTRGEGPGGGFIDEVELANAAYGQGQTFATPLQMALVAATVANGGTLMRPKLVDELRGANGGVTPLGPSAMSQVLPRGSADLIRAAMVQAVEGEWGRGFAGGARIPGVTTAGKGGTAEVDDTNRPHSWFIGFAPAEAPRIAIAVLVQEGGFASERAVPIAGDLMEAYLKLPAE
ncbi:MAG: penicillin-binding protein 2 [Chloroflexi bacterium]|nr:penicillin-binding protein 2 [Chloroflexota bacterium]